MKKALKIIGIILLILFLGIAIAWFGFLKPEPPPVTKEDRAAIHLMPLPSELKLGNRVFLIDEAMAHELTTLSTPRLERAVDRFYEKLSRQTGMDLGYGSEKTLILECGGTEKAYPSLGDDESYSISVSSGKILVKAPEETGIIYALETLLQLTQQEEGAWIIPALVINDHPRYPWRGLMIDACRHWIPREVILQNLEAMGALKMNTFHWHLSESQAFRIESHIYPALHALGSNGDYYTQEDIREVIEFAADRAIRVVPEFDVPGHSASWFVGYPELASGPGPYQLDTGMMGSQPAMDPTRDEVYEFLDQFFGEMAGLFPDEFLHIGGDEVVPTQWTGNPEIQKYMKDHDLEDPHALQAHFNTRLQKIVAGHDKKMMGWDEILHPDLPRGEIAVQTWRDQRSLWETARLGNQAVLSAGYYLDQKEPASYHYGVDPAVIPGAVDIETDSLNWKGWECTLSIGDMIMDGELYLFGEGQDQRGIMVFMDSPMGFTRVSTDGQNLSFVLVGPMGEMEFGTRLLGDSIAGSSRISVFNLLMNGKRSGGSDMPGGKPLPEFKRIEPLTPDQEDYLIGGEACMWSEQVNELTIESRIWPRAAAIAEKLWSPPVLTDDVDDLYRRLRVMDRYLEQLGLIHNSYRNILLSDMVPDPYQEPLLTLAEMLQEDKYFSRMVLYHPQFYTSTPLNRMVDLAPPESYVSYWFGRDVDLWMKNGDKAALERMNRQLQIWSANHELLLPAIDGNERLTEIQAHSEHLSQLADLALLALNDPASLAGKENEIMELLEDASLSFGATNLPLTQDVQKLLSSATKK